MIPLSAIKKPGITVVYVFHYGIGMRANVDTKNKKHKIKYDWYNQNVQYLVNDMIGVIGKAV